MIDLRKGNYISRIWFFSGQSYPMDVLAQLWRRLPDGPWRFDYRFRYYKDGQAHDSSDEKSGYEGQFEGDFTEDEMLEKVAPAIAGVLLCLPAGFTVDEVEVQTDEPRAIIHLLGKRPWAHFKTGETPT